MYEEWFPKRLAELRMKKDVSARDMSLSIGQSVNYINQIENKKALPSMQVFFYICDYLNITPGQFFDDKSDNPELVNQLVAVLKTLDDVDLESILAIAQRMGKDS